VGGGGGSIQRQLGQGQAMRSIVDPHCTGGSSACVNRDGATASTVDTEGGDVGSHVPLRSGDGGPRSGGR
jgi:hypothetical protein